MPSQNGQTLELQPQVPASQNVQGPQGNYAPQPNQDNARVIPVIPPSAQVLSIPQASTDFIGEWGGTLQLQRKFGDVTPPGTAITSFMFGERAGSVVLATTVFGSPDSQVLETKATTEGPQTVKLKLAGLDLSHQPPVRHIETVSLQLIDPTHVRCTKTVDLYVSGFPDPSFEAEYEGTLHPLTNRDKRMIAEDLMRSGAVPRARIDEGGSPSDQ